jgi:hypothetical protein
LLRKLTSQTNCLLFGVSDYRDGVTYQTMAIQQIKINHLMKCEIGTVLDTLAYCKLSDISRNFKLTQNDRADIYSNSISVISATEKKTLRKNDSLSHLFAMVLDSNTN